MHYQFLSLCLGLFVLNSTNVVSAQMEQQLPEVAKALEKIVQKKNAFGGFTYDKHQVITTKENDRVPGLNGLMFVKYKNGAGEQIQMSIQWFEDKEDLISLSGVQATTTGLHLKVEFKENY